MNKDLLATTYEQALKMLADGTGAHYPMLTFALANIKAIDPDKVNDIGFFAQPGDSAASNGLTVWMPAGIYVYKNGKNVDARRSGSPSSSRRKESPRTWQGRNPTVRSPSRASRFPTTCCRQ